MASTIGLTAIALPGVTQQRPVFRGTVSRVQVDAIVTDADGRFVTDLKLEDFAVFEDGEAQQILDLQLVDMTAGTVAEIVAERAGPGETTVEPVLEPAEDPADLGAIVFVIDGPSLEPRTKSRFAVAWEGLVAQTEDLRLPRAVYMIDSVGRLEEVVALTMEAAALQKAVEAVDAEPVTGTGMRSRMYELLDVMNAPDGITAARSIARGYESAEAGRSIATLELLTRFCDALATRPGRTALVWVTTGAKLTVGGPFTVLTGGASGGDLTGTIEAYSARDSQFSPYQPHPEIEQRQRRLHEAANSANVSIYSIDPTLMSDQRSMGFDVQTRNAGDAARLGTQELQSSLDALRDSMQDAAAATGGRAFVYSTDLSQALTDIEQDSSRFYLLTYAAPPPDGDGEYHEIRVEVNRPGLTVRERGGYVDLAADERASRRIVAALTVPGTVSGLPVVARAVRRWSAAGDPIVQVAATLQSADLDVGVGSSELVFHALAVAEDGTVIDAVHQGVRSLFSRADEEALGIESSGYVYDWSLPPGNYSLRVVMEDEASGRIGATELQVEVPGVEEEWRASDLVLAASDGTGPAFPLVSDSLAFGEYLVVYVEVTGADEPVISGDVFSADGSELIKGLPPVALERSAGIHRGALILRGMDPGELVLQIAVTDAAPGRHKIFRQSLTVRPERR